MDKSEEIPSEDPGIDGDARRSQPVPAGEVLEPTFVAELADVGPTSDPAAAARRAPVVDPVANPPAPSLKPRLKLPLILFALTCLSTFLAGASMYWPLAGLDEGILDLTPLRRAVIGHWADGLLYMACVLAILLAHEMGHFAAAAWYGIPATYPFFIPFPIAPSGTMGAVIMLDGTRADRREIFDIGLAGPIAGLVVCIPVLWYGIQRLDLTLPPHGVFQLDLPLAVDLLMNYVQPEGYTRGAPISQGNLNPYFMAGWLGLLITGLNMLPMSQLDGGHVVYTLLGRRSFWIARAVMILAVAYMVYTSSATLILMMILILALGLEHPPTRDDRRPLGWFRTILGFVCLWIPLFCLPLRTLMLPPGF